MDFKFILSIDVGKEKLALQLRTADQVLWAGYVENQLFELKKVFVQFKKDFGMKPKECLVCMEHTGLYNFHLLFFLTQKQISTWVIDSKQIKLSLGIQRGKSDPIDAARIGEYAIRFNDKLVLWSPPRTIISQMKTLLSTRDRLVKVRQCLENPLSEMKEFISSTEYRNTLELSKKPIEELKISIKKTEDQLITLIKSDETIQQMFNRLDSIQGVGLITAATYIAETNEFKNFSSGKKLACHSGVVPFSYSSGKKNRNAHLSHKANKKLKALLDRCVSSALLTKGEFSDYYKRKALEGKPHFVIKNNLKNKIVLRMYAVVQNNTMYDKNYAHGLA